MRKKRVAVLGSTGSIGRATLDVIRHLPDRFEVYALAARSSTRTLYAQARRFGPEVTVLTDLKACRRARTALGPDSRVEWGLDPLINIACSPRVDIVVMAMSGTIGLLPVLAALERGKRVAIATKEILVGFGEHVVKAAARHHGELLPIDSELAAVHQCLGGRPASDIRRITLTASGGPFRRSGPPQRATVEQVLRHPTWNMGRKITVDSATLMNKGLEVIETSRLFGVKADRIGAVVHPQSIVHSLVEFNDGSLMAQLSLPDMRLPIQYCLCYPDRVPSLARPLDLEGIARLDFHPLDRKRFPCFGLALLALERGMGAPCVLNAANQIAVEAFLSGRIVFGDIPGIISRTLNEYSKPGPKRRRMPAVRTLIRLEAQATDFAAGLVNTMTGRGKKAHRK